MSGEMSDQSTRDGGDTIDLALKPTSCQMSSSDLFAKYRILEEVGRGGMAVVYRGIQESLGRQVALKVVRPEHSTQRFIREARLLARMRSPHIVTVHELVEMADGTLVLVMDWINGKDLLQTIRHEGQLPESRVLRWMEQTSRGMLAAEEEGVVHRDLKPSNVLIDQIGDAFVADFGLAKSLHTDDALSLTGQIMGTPHYMAPEQAEDPRSADVRSDIYSYGATYYHALTGRTPFDGESPFSVMLKHKTEPLVAPQSLVPTLSARVAGIVERCMAKRPADRVSSFRELVALCSSDAQFPEDEFADTYRPQYARFLERRGLYLGDPVALREADVFQFSNGRTVSISCGDIAEAAAEVIVSSDTEFLTMNFGVSKAIRKAAGEEVHQEAKRFAPVIVGRAIATSAGKLKAHFIFHCVTLAFQERGIRPTSDLIQELMASCFYHAETLQVKSIAFPLLGTGGAGFKRDLCLDVMFRYICRKIASGLTPIEKATVVIYPE